MDEQKSVINDMGLLIVAMPFIGAGFTFRLTKNSKSLKARIIASAILFIIMVVVGFLEFLWVATHFHIMLGGKI